MVLALKKTFPLILISFLVFNFINKGYSQSGTQVVQGVIKYTGFSIPQYYSDGTIELIDFSSFIRGYDGIELVPKSGQVVGFLTKPLLPSPSSFQIDLPLVPGGKFINPAKDHNPSKGFQIFSAILGLNLQGDAYLEQLEQNGMMSMQLHQKTGLPFYGTLLVYAPDAMEKFPKNWGKDKQWFTKDDTYQNLPAGYCIAILDSNGVAKIDRSRVGKMEVVLPESVASPDYSNQGILESFNSLINLFKKQYAYTELRNIDWEKIKNTYIDAVREADARKDTGAYFIAIQKLLINMQDAHVQTGSFLPSVSGKYMQYRIYRLTGGLGAILTQLSDGRFIVSDMNPNSPAQKAGWTFGTEIITINGQPVSEFIDTVPINISKGTYESIRLLKTSFATSFPKGHEVTVTFKQPGSNVIQKETLIAVAKESSLLSDSTCACRSPYEQDFSFKFLERGSVGYVQWRSFSEIPVTMRSWEHFLSLMKNRKGMIIDMRRNGGGLLSLMYTMASYLFTQENPAPTDWLDTYTYNESSDRFEKEPASHFSIYSPRPDLTYTGKVVVLVDDGSASAGEYLPQFLQKLGRAVVVAEYGSEGAGGILGRVTLPGPIPITFTKGRTFFKNTKELNLEAKGVVADIKLPVTLESIRKKKNCEDPVIDAAIKYLLEQ